MDIKRCIHCSEACTGKFCSTCDKAEKRRAMCKENAFIRHAAGLKDLECKWVGEDGVVTVLCGWQYALAGLKDPQGVSTISPEHPPMTKTQEKWIEDYRYRLPDPFADKE